MSTPLPKTDVVIIGMGAAGGIASYVLTKAGINVVGIEAGPRLGIDDFVSHLDELSSFGRNWMGAPKVNKEVPTWRPTANAPIQAPPTPPALMMNAVGGTSIHWGAQSWRQREDDFKIRSTTIAKYGEESLPPGTAVADWPISYDELEPYYDQVEHLVGVSGKAGNINGELVEGGNPFESPRSRDYPMPPLQSFGYGELVTEATTALGYHPFPQPAAIASEPFNDRPACTYCGFCVFFGCWNNSKSSTLVSAIAEAEKTGKLEIRPNSRVMQILTNDKGQVTGVQYLDEQGNLQEQPAGVVILATYVYENTRMLLLSKSGVYPNGLANNHGQVGKYYMTHSAVGASGFFPGKNLGTFSGTTGQAIIIDDLNGDNFDHTGLGFIRGGSVYASVGQNWPINASRAVAPGVPTWGPEYKRWIHENSESIGSIKLQLETLPYEANSLDLDPRQKDPLGVPVTRVTYSIGDNEHIAGAYFAPKLEEIVKAMGASQVWSTLPVTQAIYTHAYGGTRMGEEETTSVVNKYGLAHEAPNLAVLGGSTFPSTTGYNPTETIEAHAWYAADYIAQHLNDIAV